MELFFLWIILTIVIGFWSKNKGRGFAFGFFLSLFLSPLIGGLIVAISKPNLEKVEAKAVESGEMKKCPHCAELIRVEAVKCRYCGSELSIAEPEPSDPESKKPEPENQCHRCGAKVKEDSITC